MSPQYEDELVRVAPTFYGKLDWGFECGDGWFKLLLELGKAVEALNTELEPRVRATQLKEKFGDLRCYTSRFDPNVEALIRKAEEKAARTCERCGKRGKLRTGGWLRCLCEGCAKERR